MMQLNVEDDGRCKKLGDQDTILSNMHQLFSPVISPEMSYIEMCPFPNFPTSFGHSHVCFFYVLQIVAPMLIFRAKLFNSSVFHYTPSESSAHAFESNPDVSKGFQYGPALIMDHCRIGQSTESSPSLSPFSITVFSPCC